MKYLFKKDTENKLRALCKNKGYSEEKTLMALDVCNEAWKKACLNIEYFRFLYQKKIKIFLFVPNKTKLQIKTDFK